MLITSHWSATEPPFAVSDYHVQYVQVHPLDRDFVLSLIKQEPLKIDWVKLKSAFKIYKIMNFYEIPEYATWHINRDPRDGSPDIAMAAICMANATLRDFGKYPFDYAHAFMMAGLAARIARIENIDVTESFGVDANPLVLQNPPIYTFSTHAERRLQTQDNGEGGCAIFLTL